MGTYVKRVLKTFISQFWDCGEGKVFPVLDKIA